MGLFASASKRDVKGAVDALGSAAATAQAQAQGAIGQAQALGADGQAAYTELKDGADEKVQEAMALKAQLQDANVPVAAKALAVFRFLLPVLKGLWHLLCCLLPLYFKLFEYLYFAYTWAPKKLVTMTFGVVLCFFGGTYVASLAAIEAFINMGGERLWADIVYVYEQCKLVVKANYKDEEKGGGIKDALNSAIDEGEMPGPELAQRKVYMAMQTIREPGRLENAVGSLWSAYVAVLATLSLQFAQVAALALGMASTVKPVVTRVMTPALEYVMDDGLVHCARPVPPPPSQPTHSCSWARDPPECAHATPWAHRALLLCAGIASIINVTLNLLAMSIAWYLMAVVASVYSGLRGGKLFAEALFGMLADYGLIEKIPWEGCRKVFDPSTSYLDEALAYSLAAAGIYTQVFSGFAIFFPLNIVLMPLSAIEWFLRYQITFGGTSPTQ